MFSSVRRFLVNSMFYFKGDTNYRLLLPRANVMAGPFTPDSAQATAEMLPPVELGPKQTRILIVGGKSAGKSALANLIVGKSICRENDDFFADSGSEMVVNYKAHSEFVIIDTPGLVHDPDSHRHKKAITSLVEAIEQCREGIDVVILVVKTGSPLGTLESLCQLLYILGDDSQKNVIIASTFAGDSVYQDDYRLFLYENLAANEQVMSFFHRLCQGRMVPIENPGTMRWHEEAYRERSRRLLVECIKEAVSDYEAKPFKPDLLCAKYYAAKLKSEKLAVAKLFLARLLRKGFNAKRNSRMLARELKKFCK